jgi:Zn-dependent protease
MLPFDPTPIISAITVFILPAIFAITFHEAAHGFVAHKLGDDTAWRMGRVTFNPLRHIDLFGTIVIPLVLILTAGIPFGYAKPVPVNFNQLRHPRTDMIWVALAGPVTNIILAIVSALLLYIVPFVPEAGARWLQAALQGSINLNIVLAVFNMLPLPPLDGGRVAVGILPDALAFRLAGMERYGLVLIVGLLILMPMLGQRLGMDLDVFGYLVGIPSAYAKYGILWLTGHV